MMDFKNDIINENLFELVKKYIDDLYDVKMQLKNVFMTCNLDNNLDMKKKSSTLQFKLKNYNRWKLLE